MRAGLTDHSRSGTTRAPSSRGARDLADDLPVAQLDGAVPVGGGERVVRDHDDGQVAARCSSAAQQIEDGLAAARVEVAGRLVGEQQHRIGHQRAGDGDALLLAARQLGGAPVGGAAGDADLLERLAGARARLAPAHAEELERPGDVLLHA